MWILLVPSLALFSTHCAINLTPVVLSITGDTHLCVDTHTYTHTLYLRQQIEADNPTEAYSNEIVYRELCKLERSMDFTTFLA